MRLCYCFSAVVMSLAWLSGMARAELQVNPDANTLWIEDGRQIKSGVGSSDQHWTNALEFSEVESGGFKMRGEGPGKSNSGRYVDFDPAYPWLVWEITEVTPGAPGYRALSFRTLDMPQSAFVGMISFIQPGIFAVRTDYAHPTAKRTFFRIDLHNCDVTMKYLKLVAQPENYIEVTGPTMDSKKVVELNDEVTFVARLAEPAEDVSLRFYDNYMMPQLTINGSQQLQLKPVDAEQKIWMATVKLESCTGYRRKPDSQFSPGSFLVKAIVLGGSLNTPIWGANPVEFRVISGR